MKLNPLDARTLLEVFYCITNNQGNDSGKMKPRDSIIPRVEFLLDNTTESI